MINFVMTVIMHGVCKVHNIAVDEETSKGISENIQDSFPKGQKVTFDEIHQWALANEQTAPFFTPYYAKLVTKHEESKDN